MACIDVDLCLPFLQPTDDIDLPIERTRMTCMHLSKMAYRAVVFQWRFGNHDMGVNAISSVRRAYVCVVSQNGLSFVVANSFAKPQCRKLGDACQELANQCEVAFITLFATDMNSTRSLAFDERKKNSGSDLAVQ